MERPKIRIDLVNVLFKLNKQTGDEQFIPEGQKWNGKEPHIEVQGVSVTLEEWNLIIGTNNRGGT